MIQFKLYTITANFVEKWMSYLPSIFEYIQAQYNYKMNQLMPIKVIKEKNLKDVPLWIQ